MVLSIVYLFEVLLALSFGSQPCVLHTCLFGLCPHALTWHAVIWVNKKPCYLFLRLYPDPFIPTWQYITIGIFVFLLPVTFQHFSALPYCPWVVQRSKALHLSARGVTTVPGSNPGCITSDRDWESHRAAAQLAQRRPGGAQLAQRCPGLAVIVNKNLFLTDLPI